MMKLPIKKEYFDMIKEGTKRVEFRDAHITFVCEETGEIITKEIENIDFIDNPIAIRNMKNNYPNCFTDDRLIRFHLRM